MNKNTFFHIMKNIINNFEQFQKSIQNKDYENVIPYLIDNKKEDYNSNSFLSDAIYFEFHLLEKHSAPEVYEMYVQLTTYLTYLENVIPNLVLKNNIRLIVSMIQNDFMSITEKLVRMESLKLLSIMSQYNDLLEMNKIPVLCKNFSLPLYDYSYLLGYDECKNEYEQISFMVEDDNLDSLDSIAGNRRISYRKKLVSSISTDFLESPFLQNSLCLIQKHIDNYTFSFLEDEIRLLSEKKKKPTSFKSDSYQYYFTIK